MKLKFLFFLFLAGLQLQAQKYFPKNDGVKTTNTSTTVFKNAKIHVNPAKVIENGMFGLKDGKITAIGKSISVPDNSQLINLQGKEV